MKRDNQAYARCRLLTGTPPLGPGYQFSSTALCCLPQPSTEHGGSNSNSHPRSAGSNGICQSARQCDDAVNIVHVAEASTVSADNAVTTELHPMHMNLQQVAYAL